MEQEIKNKVITTIKESKFFNKFGDKTFHINENRTVSYSISLWEKTHEITIRLNGNYRGRTQSLDALIKKLCAFIEIVKYEWTNKIVKITYK